MKQTATIPVPKFVIPPQIRQATNPVVQLPTTTVLRPLVPTPNTTINIPVPTPKTQQTVPTPITTQGFPQGRTQVTNVVLPTPRQTQQTVITQPQQTVIMQPQQTVPRTVVATPTPTQGRTQTTNVVLPTPQRTQQTVPRPVVATPTPAQGGLLRQFGAGGVTTILTQPQVTAAPTVTIVTETGYSILMRLLNTWGGTDEEARQLAALQYTNGNPIIDVKRRDVIMEIIGMLQYQLFKDVLDFITDAPNPEFILWNQESLDEGRIKVAREITIQQVEEIGVKGVGKCRYCPSTELVFAMKQLRSGDEPATVFVRCVLCNKQWRQ